MGNVNKQTAEVCTGSVNWDKSPRVVYKDTEEKRKTIQAEEEDAGQQGEEQPAKEAAASRGIQAPAGRLVSSPASAEGADGGDEDEERPPVVENIGAQVLEEENDPQHNEDGADHPGACTAGGAAQKLRRSVSDFRRFLDTDPAVQLCDDNPFGVKVELRALLGKALGELDRQLDAIIQ